MEEKGGTTVCGTTRKNGGTAVNIYKHMYTCTSVLNEGKNLYTQYGPLYTCIHCGLFYRYPEDEIEGEVEALRQRLLSEGYKDLSTSVVDSHHMAVVNEKKNEKFRNAFGISKEYMGGSAFDPNRQAEKVAERKAKREEREAERERKKQEREEERMKIEKEREKELKYVYMYVLMSQRLFIIERNEKKKRERENLRSLRSIHQSVVIEMTVTQLIQIVKRNAIEENTRRTARSKPLDHTH